MEKKRGELMPLYQRFDPPPPPKTGRSEPSPVVRCGGGWNDETGQRGRSVAMQTSVSQHS